MGGYTSARDQERARIDIARENLGGVGTALEVAGGGAGILARPGQVMAAGRSVAASGQPISRPAVQNALARQAGRDGARIGAVGGFGYGEGLEGSAINTAGGAVLGGALGYGGQRLGNALANRATLAGMQATWPVLDRRKALQSTVQWRTLIPAMPLRSQTLRLSAGAECSATWRL